MSVRATRLVVTREIREAARRKGIWALVALTFLASLALVVAPDVIPEGGGGDRVMVAGTDDIGLTETLRAMTHPRLEVSTGDGRDDITAAIEAGDVDVGVVLTPGPTLIVEDDQADVVNVVAQVVADRVTAARLTEVGIDPDQVRAAFADASPTLELVDVDRRDKQGVAFAISMLLYLLTVILTSQVANAVAVEKANRVSEVLLAIIPSRALLFGKVIGVGCIGLITLAAGATPVVVRFVGGGDLPSGLVRSLAASAVWFVGGLALYLILAGALGALASRQEEAGAIVVPLTMILVVSYIVAISSGESRLSEVLAYVPLTSPMIVPYRIAVGAGSIVEYVVSAVLLAAAVVLAARVGAVVFRRAIVRTGRRLTLRDVL